MKTPYKFIPFFSPLYRSSKSLISSQIYRGKSVFCPLCKTSFKSWIGSKGYGSCPKCRSEARHRLLYLFLERKGNFFETPHKILHFAPEQCWKNQLTKIDNIEYVTADISAPEADFKIDITDVDFDNGTFDVIFCSHVLEHIVDDCTAINELYRVVADAGTVYIQVPYNPNQITDEDPSIQDPQVRKARFGQFDHVRQYGTDLQYRLESPGFKVTKHHFAQDLTLQQRNYYGLWDDVLFECVKNHDVLAS